MSAYIDEYLGQSTPDLGILDALPAHEREQAVDALLVAAQSGSVPAIQGLAHLRADRAAEPLRMVMRRYNETARVYAAAALWWLRRDPEALATLCGEAVHRSRRAPHRVHAVAILSQIDHPDARRALARVIHDPDYDIRYHAFEGLAPVLGRRREIWNYVCKPDIHHHVRARVDALLRRAGYLD